MGPQQKRTALILAIIGLAYWLVFIPTSLQGAQNPDMLAIFEIDEYAQYPNALHMVSQAGSLFESLHNFAVYQHYFYGYPFYFFSGLVLLLGKVIFGASWIANTPFVVAALRQSINVLPMALAAGLFTWIVTRFKQRWTSIVVFVLLLTIPGVLANNYWWHPDSLGVLLVALVYFFLERDQMRFGRFWLLAAAACGVGLSVKYVGAFFVLTIPLYLFLAWRQKQLTLAKGIGQAGLFLLVMVLGLVISNPLLLLPQERPEIIRYQILQFSQTNVGIILKHSFAETLAKFWETIQGSYGGLLAIGLVLASLIYGLWQPTKRTYTLLVLSWSLPYAIVVLNVSNFRPHYLLPLMLPLLSLVAYPLIDAISAAPAWPRKPVSSWVIWLAALGLILFNLPQDITGYQVSLNKETGSASIQFYQHLQSNPLLTSLEGQSLTVYRDWQVYFPSSGDVHVEMDWNKASYPVIDALDPDVILLDRREVALYAPEDVVTNSVDSGNVSANHAFYLDAQNNQIPGYQLVDQDSFGLAFVKDQWVQNQP